MNFSYCLRVVNYTNILPLLSKSWNYTFLSMQPAFFLFILQLFSFLSYNGIVSELFHLFKVLLHAMPMQNCFSSENLSNVSKIFPGNFGDPDSLGKFPKKSIPSPGKVGKFRVGLGRERGKFPRSQEHRTGPGGKARESRGVTGVTLLQLVFPLASIRASLLHKFKTLTLNVCVKRGILSH